MENSNKHQQTGLKDISNITRNLVSAFPQVSTATFKNNIITNTSMKTTSSKGQLISEWRFGCLNFPKTIKKNWWIFALGTKKWWNQNDQGAL